MTKLTKAEREELRKIASDFAACEMHIEDVLPGAGMLTTPAATALRALPRLLADIAAAEAELGKAREQHISDMARIAQRHLDAVAERDDAKAKLAALVEASRPFANDQGCDAVHHAVADRHDHREGCPVVARLRAAITAARGGAS